MPLRESASEVKTLAPSNGAPYGSRGGFRKITITLPQESYERLISEAARRKIAAEPNHLLSALIREALTSYLERLQPKNPQPATEKSSR